jgi:alkylresorcinol/alkylpyrone synthase
MNTTIRNCELRPKLLSLATAVPEHVLKTEDVLVEAMKIFGGRHEDFHRMIPVYANSGIHTRYSSQPYEWFREDKGWPERTEAFLAGATKIFAEVSCKALERAGLEAGQIDSIVMISSTGIATPTIEARVMSDLGFRDDVKRIPVFGLGCAGGLAGVSLAARLAAAEPGKNILTVVIELCSLTFRADEMSKSNIIATALFGDGAAAAVLSTAGQSAHGEIEFMGEHTWPDTLDIMGWRMDAQGFGAIFSRSIPELAVRDLRPAADAFLARNELSFEDVGAYSFHPGGAKVIVALETAFSLEQGQLQNERKILGDYGNMSAPTVLFVLEEGLKEDFSGRRFVSALGPGFTASFITMLQ